MKLLFVQFPTASLLLLILRSKYCPQHPVPKLPQPIPFAENVLFESVCILCYAMKLRILIAIILPSSLIWN
jgi:hypothetical protein